MSVINDLIPPEPTPTIMFDWSPKGDPFTWTAGSTTYTPAGQFFTPVFTPVTFTATTDFYGTGLYPVDYRWDFGDDTFGYGNPVTHTYKVENPQLQVVLRVTDNQGKHWFTRRQAYIDPPGFTITGSGHSQVFSGRPTDAPFYNLEPTLEAQTGFDSAGLGLFGLRLHRGTVFTSGGFDWIGTTQTPGDVATTIFPAGTIPDAYRPASPQIVRVVADLFFGDEQTAPHWWNTQVNPDGSWIFLPSGSIPDGVYPSSFWGGQLFVPVDTWPNGASTTDTGFSYTSATPDTGLSGTIQFASHDGVTHFSGTVTKANHVPQSDFLNYSTGASPLPTFTFSDPSASQPYGTSYQIAHCNSSKYPFRLVEFLGFQGNTNMFLRTTSPGFPLSKYVEFTGDGNGTPGAVYFGGGRDATTITNQITGQIKLAHTNVSPPTVGQSVVNGSPSPWTDLTAGTVTSPFWIEANTVISNSAGIGSYAGIVMRAQTDKYYLLRVVALGSNQFREEMIRVDSGGQTQIWNGGTFTNTSPSGIWLIPWRISTEVNAAGNVVFRSGFPGSGPSWSDTSVSKITAVGSQGVQTNLIGGTGFAYVDGLGLFNGYEPENRESFGVSEALDLSPVLLRTDGGPTTTPFSGTALVGRWDFSGAEIIPDNDPTGYTITFDIPNIDNAAVDQIDVSFYITHTFDGDLQIHLIHPDGTIVDLVLNEGTGGDNFGSGTADANRTTITDSAATAISAGSAPFVGSFKPENVLLALTNKPAAGFWKLKFVDTASADIGTIHAASLIFHT